MNVFIETDLEGISGVSTAEMVSASDRYALERLMADTNAAVRGALDGGAERVFVLDGHGGGRNFIPELLDPRAEQTGIDRVKEADLCFLVGMHAMAGTQNAFLDHTQSSVAWHHYRINGRRYGELGQLAAYAGAYGVPVGMVSGDLAACAEARGMLGNIETAVVKWADGRNRAVCLPDGEAEELIRAAACRAVNRAAGRAGEFRTLAVTLPAAIEVEFNRCDYADGAAARNPALERIDGYTVRRLVPVIRDYSDVLI